MRTGRLLHLALAATLVACTTTVSFAQGAVRSQLDVRSVSGRAGTTVNLSAILTAPDLHVPLVGDAVSFYVDDEPVAIVTTDATGLAVAAYAIPSNMAAGAHVIKAVFAGRVGVAGCTGYGVLGVTSTTRVWVRSITSTPLALTRFTAVLQETPKMWAVDGRTLSFQVDGVPIGSGVTGPPSFAGLAAVLWTVPSGTAAGAHSITVEFAGDAYCAASSGSGTLTVGKSKTRVWTWSKTARPGDAVGISGFLFRSVDNTALDGRTLAFTVDGTSIGSAPTGTTTPGRADVTYVVPDSAPAGSSATGVAFAGDAAYQASSAAAELITEAAETFTWVGSRHAREGIPVRIKALVRRYAGYLPRENKTVVFKVSGVPFDTATTGADGWAYGFYTVPDGLDDGTYPVSAEFAGDADDLASSGAADLIVIE